MTVYHMNRAQCAEVDPSWGYENPDGDGTFTPGWYFWPEGYELPVGPYATKDEGEGAAYRFLLNAAVAREA